MKKFLIIMFLIVMVWILTACSAISDGTITEKNHQEGYYSSMMVCGMYNTKGGCSFWTMQQIWHPPSWWFDLAKEEKGEIVTGWVYVGQETYNSYSVGAYYEQGQAR